MPNLSRRSSSALPRSIRSLPFDALYQSPAAGLSQSGVSTAATVDSDLPALIGTRRAEYKILKHTKHHIMREKQALTIRRKREKRGSGGRFHNFFWQEQNLSKMESDEVGKTINPHGITNRLTAKKLVEVVKKESSAGQNSGNSALWSQLRDDTLAKRKFVSDADKTEVVETLSSSSASTGAVVDHMVSDLLSSAADRRILSLEEVAQLLSVLIKRSPDIDTKTTLMLLRKLDGRRLTMDTDSAFESNLKYISSIANSMGDLSTRSASARLEWHTGNQWMINCAALNWALHICEQLNSRIADFGGAAKPTVSHADSDRRRDAFTFKARKEPALLTRNANHIARLVTGLRKIVVSSQVKESNCHPVRTSSSLSAEESYRKFLQTLSTRVRAESLSGGDFACVSRCFSLLTKILIAECGVGGRIGHSVRLDDLETVVKHSSTVDSIVALWTLISTTSEALLSRKSEVTGTQEVKSCRSILRKIHAKLLLKVYDLHTTREITGTSMNYLLPDLSNSLRAQAV